MKGKYMRKPDETIGGTENPYMLRWYIIPRNKYFNVYLHKFLRSDDDRALHDHPWANVSIILRGSYYEEVPSDPARWRTRGDRKTLRKLRRAFRPVFRGANSIHRVELLPDVRTWLKESSCPSTNRREISQIVGVKPVWTLFLTGPWQRRWGFWLPTGWMHWEEYEAKYGPGAPK